MDNWNVYENIYEAAKNEEYYRGEYSEAELQRKLADEEDIVSFAATIFWFIANRGFDLEDLSPFEKLIWERILWAVVRYWDPRSLGCPL
jgi:hypothetical protein